MTWPARAGARGESESDGNINPLFTLLSTVLMRAHHVTTTLHPDVCEPSPYSKLSDTTCNELSTLFLHNAGKG